MAVVALVTVGVGWIASLLPFLFPGSIFSVFGAALNGWLGELLASGLGVGFSPGPLVIGNPGDASLTLAGVSVVYGPLFLVLALVYRRRH